MGIPHFFRHFARRCPRSIRIVDASDASGTDELFSGGSKYRQLYVDFNSVIHGCAREVQDGCCIRRMQMQMQPPPPSKEELEDRIMTACTAHLDHLVRVIQPSELVYVAIDGRPPRGKMHQQRLRRFMSAAAEAEAEARWDTNAVTPGTEFMAQLTTLLTKEAAARRTVGGAKWVVSGSDEEGEGEQKILHHARGIAQAGQDGGLKAAVYGLDADLLLMSISFLNGMGGGHLVHVVREQELRGPLQIVDASELARHLIGDLGSRLSTADFPAMCGLLGNDFVPALPGLRIRDGGIDAVVRAYRLAVSQTGWLASGGPASIGGFNPSVLCKILEVLSRDEGAAMVAAERSHAEARMRALGRPREHAHAHDAYPLLAGYDGTSVRPGEPGWRPRYYRTLFGRGGTPPSTRSICVEYIAALAWSACYLSHDGPGGSSGGRCLSWGWHYPHAHAPTALDLHMTLMSCPAKELAKEIELMFEEADRAHLAGERIAESVMGSREGWQLLMVLPPRSMHLLPTEHIRRVMTDVDKGCAHMFPERFTMATYLKEKLHECSPLLPVLDPVRLVKSLSA